MKKVYLVRDREAGNVIETFKTFKEANEQVFEFELKDLEDNTYAPNFYEIVEREVE